MVTTSKFGILTIRQHSATRKHLFLYPPGDRPVLRKPKKKISIKTNHSYHHRSSPKPVPTDLAIKPDSDLTNPVGKDGGVKLVGVNYPFCCDTITRRLKRHLLSRWYDWPGWRPTQYFNV